MREKMNRSLKKILGLVFCTVVFLSSYAIVNQSEAKSAQTQSHQKKNTKKATKAHYVIIYKDEYGRQVTFNTYAKSKDEAKHNLYQTRKVKKILNVTKK
jgi:vancomycin permeability regulator SanA